MTSLRTRAASPRSAVRRALPWVAASLTLAVVASLTPAAGAAPVGPTLPSPCVPLGPLQGAGVRSGASAVMALGSELPVAAARNSMSPNALTALLRSDRRARLDACGRVYFAEPVLSGPVASSAAVAPTSSAAALPGALDVSGNVFGLASRPGSARTIYLDFTGHVLTGTGWNAEFGVKAGYRLAAYDTNGSAAFSTAEQNAIRSIWMRVAEDYAPFDVNVTTAEPAAGVLERSDARDVVYGSRVVITNDTALLDACGCGGIAYVGAFGLAYDHERYQPALVFTHGLESDTKAIAEAAAHEVGHNFGLLHDGSVSSPYSMGQGLWAPIMGASYYRPLTQWSNGDYRGATETQDDAEIIAVNAPYVADEVGTSPASAPLLTSGRGVAGVVSGPDDVDFFAFVSGGGSVAVAVTPEAVSPDLDVRLDVFTASSVLVATANPASTWISSDAAGGLGAAWSTAALPAGRYVVAVSGAGSGSPADTGYSSYGSRGRYAVTVLYTAPARLTVATSALPEAVSGTPYAVQLAATQASGATTWRVVSGVLPAGLSLDAATGIVSGTTTALGRYPVSFGVVDVSASASAAFALDVVAPVAIVSTSLPAGTVGRPYSAAILASGGDGGYVVTRASGVLPPGLVITSSGRVYGTPTTAGRYSVTARVADYVGREDLAGRVATRTFSVVVARPVAVTTLRLPAARAGRSYAAQLVGSGGSGTLTWARTAGSLPPGTSLGATGRITGTPKHSGRWSATIVARDPSGRTATRTFLLTVT